MIGWKPLNAPWLEVKIPPPSVPAVLFRISVESTATEVGGPGVTNARPPPRWAAVLPIRLPLYKVRLPTPTATPPPSPAERLLSIVVRSRYVVAVLPPSSTRTGGTFRPPPVVVVLLPLIVDRPMLIDDAGVPLRCDIEKLMPPSASAAVSPLPVTPLEYMVSPPQLPQRIPTRPLSWIWVKFTDILLAGKPWPVLLIPARVLFEMVELSICSG